MDAVAFTLALGALAFIHLTVACGSSPTSKDGLLSYYQSTNCQLFEDLPTKFKPNMLLVNCNGKQANISVSSVNYITTLFARCILPDGTCLEKNVFIHIGSSGAVINLQANSTDCLFGGCGYGIHDNENIFFNLSRCAVDAESTSIVTTLPSASTSPQETSGAPTETTSTPDRHKLFLKLCVSALLVIILVAAILTLAFTNMAVRARKRKIFKQLHEFNPADGTV